MTVLHLPPYFSRGPTEDYSFVEDADDADERQHCACVITNRRMDKYNDILNVFNNF